MVKKTVQVPILFVVPEEYYIGRRQTNIRSITVKIEEMCKKYVLEVDSKQIIMTSLCQKKTVEILNTPWAIVMMTLLNTQNQTILQYSLHSIIWANIFSP